MTYDGICLDGPRGGQHCSHHCDVMEVPVRPPVPPSAEFGEGVVSLAAVRIEKFRYHAVQIVAGAETHKFWIPEEWYREGQSFYTAKIISFLTEQYASGT